MLPVPIEFLEDPFEPGEPFILRCAGGTGSLFVRTASGDDVIIENIGALEYIPVLVKVVFGALQGSDYSGSVMAIF